MSAYEYRVIPAPRKGEKAKGLKTPEARIAQAMETNLNAFAADGWTYVRSDVVPMEERAGLTSKSTSYHTVLVFRRAVNVPVALEDTAPTETDIQDDTTAAAEAHSDTKTDFTAPDIADTTDDTTQRD